MQAATESLRLPSEYQRESQRVDRPIKIFEQALPKDLFESEDYYPCATVELLEVRDVLNEGSTATVAISCGVFAKEFDAWKDCFHLTETIRRYLLEHRTLENQFRLEGEVLFQIPDRQPTPFMFAYAEATYQIYQYQEVYHEQYDIHR